MDTQRKVEIINQLQHSLNNLPYPITKEEIIEQMRLVSSGNDVIDLLSGIPDGTFTSAQEILEAIP